MCPHTHRAVEDTEARSSLLVTPDLSGSERPSWTLPRALASSVCRTVHSLSKGDVDMSYGVHSSMVSIWVNLTVLTKLGLLKN